MLCAVSSSPTVRRRTLALELVRLREAAGLTMAQAAEQVGISPSHLSRVERAEVGVSVPVVKGLLAAYSAEPETVQHLTIVAKEATKRGWWQQYAGAISADYATYIGFEAGADQIWSFDATTLPGLLHTEPYARAIFHGAGTRLTPDEIDRRTAVRLQRQEILIRDDPPKVWFLLDEAAIRRQVGGPAALAEQLEHIVKVAALPNVDIQVMPFSIGAHPGTPGSFIVLRFAEPNDPPVVYIETMAGDLYPENPAQVEGVVQVFDRLRAMALSPDDSIALIRKAAKELK